MRLRTGNVKDSQGRTLQRFANDQHAYLKLGSSRTDCWPPRKQDRKQARRRHVAEHCSGNRWRSDRRIFVQFRPPRSSCVFGFLQRLIITTSNNVQKEKIYMPRDSRQQWAEFHLRAAHAYLAPTQQGKQDHQAGHEQSRQALEHSAKAFQSRRRLVRNLQTAWEKDIVHHARKVVAHDSGNISNKAVFQSLRFRR